MQILSNKRFKVLIGLVVFCLLYWLYSIELRPRLTVITDDVFYHALLNGDVPIIKQAIKGDYTAEKLNSMNVLHLLLRKTPNNRLEILKLLIKQGVDLNHQPASYDYKTPLMVLGFNEDFESARLLIDAGADITKEDKNGNTALHFVSGVSYSYAESCELAKVLVDSGIDPNHENKAGKPAADLTFCKSYF